MGLLDEAIREHLDLKRRRGADPTEVERAEREALGPVRRAPGPVSTDVEVQDPSAESGFAYDHEDEAWDDGRDVMDAPAHAAGPSRPESDPLEPDFGEDPLHEHGSEPAQPPEPRRSRLSRIFGRPEAEPELDDDEELNAPPPEPRGRAADPAYDEPSPPPMTPAPHRAGGDQIGDHTVEYHVDEALEAESEPPTDEDVLEETPEFLQDTPDHDRLWFEQRPPRDFDFDG